MSLWSEVLQAGQRHEHRWLLVEFTCIKGGIASLLLNSHSVVVCWALLTYSSIFAFFPSAVEPVISAASIQNSMLSFLEIFDLLPLRCVCC